MIDLNEMDRQHVAALARLSEPQNAQFMDILQLELDKSKNLLVRTSDTDHIHRLQGRAGFIMELLGAARKAPEILK